MAENENTIVEGDNLPAHLADNYRALVADPNRNLTYKKLAKRADQDGDHELASWARAEAAKSGKDTTPTAATPGLDQVKRDADKAAKAAGEETHAKTTEEAGQVDAAETPGTTPPTGVPVDYNAHTVDELKELVGKREGIDPAGLKLKADYVAALELDDESKATS